MSVCRRTRRGRTRSLWRWFWAAVWTSTPKTMWVEPASFAVANHSHVCLAYRGIWFGQVMDGWMEQVMKCTWELNPGLLLGDSRWIHYTIHAVVHRKYWSILNNPIGIGRCIAWLLYCCLMFHVMMYVHLIWFHDRKETQACITCPRRRVTDWCRCCWRNRPMPLLKTM